MKKNKQIRNRLKGSLGVTKFKLKHNIAWYVIEKKSIKHVRESL